MEGWNAVGILPSPETERVELVSDASGSWGCAAVWGTQWLQWQWNAKVESWHIAPKEFNPSSAIIVHSVGDGVAGKAN